MGYYLACIGVVYEVHGCVSSMDTWVECMGMHANAGVPGGALDVRQKITRDAWGAWDAEHKAVGRTCPAAHDPC